MEKTILTSRRHKITELKATEFDTTDHVQRTYSLTTNSFCENMWNVKRDISQCLTSAQDFW